MQITSSLGTDTGQLLVGLPWARKGTSGFGQSETFPVTPKIVNLTIAFECQMLIAGGPICCTTSRNVTWALSSGCLPLRVRLTACVLTCAAICSRFVDQFCERLLVFAHPVHDISKRLTGKVSLQICEQQAHRFRHVSGGVIRAYMWIDHQVRAGPKLRR
jgi:hypothetical protein